MIWIGLIIAFFILLLIAMSGSKREEIEDLSDTQTSSKKFTEEQTEEQADKLSEEEIQQFIEEEVLNKVFQETLDCSYEYKNTISDAILIFLKYGRASTSSLQRELRINYNLAGVIVDKLEELNFVGPFNGSNAREVLYKNIPNSYTKYAQNNPKRVFFKEQILAEYTEEINQKVSQRLMEYEKEKPLPNSRLKSNRINNKDTDFAMNDKYSYIEDEAEDHEIRNKFVKSAIIGYMTNSAILGTLLGGNILGGLLGDHLNKKDKK